MQFKPRVIDPAPISAVAQQADLGERKDPAAPRRGQVREKAAQDRQRAARWIMPRFGLATAAKVSTIGHRSAAQRAILAHVRTLRLFARPGREVPVARRQDDRSRNAAELRKLAAQYVVQAAEIESRE